VAAAECLSLPVRPVVATRGYWDILPRAEPVDFDPRLEAARWRVHRSQQRPHGHRAETTRAFEMCGTAVWEVGTDGLLRHNWVERNAFEVYGAITRSDGRHNVF